MFLRRKYRLDNQLPPLQPVAITTNALAAQVHLDEIRKEAADA